MPLQRRPWCSIVGPSLRLALKRFRFSFASSIARPVRTWFRHNLTIFLPLTNSLLKRRRGTLDGSAISCLAVLNLAASRWKPQQGPLRKSLIFILTLVEGEKKIEKMQQEEENTIKSPYLSSLAERWMCRLPRVGHGGLRPPRGFSV